MNSKFETTTTSDTREPFKGAFKHVKTFMDQMKTDLDSSMARVKIAAASAAADSTGHSTVSAVIDTIGWFEETKALLAKWWKAIKEWVCMAYKAVKDAVSVVVATMGVYFKVIVELFKTYWVDFKDFIVKLVSKFCPSKTSEAQEAVDELSAAQKPQFTTNCPNHGPPEGYAALTPETALEGPWYNGQDSCVYSEGSYIYTTTLDAQGWRDKYEFDENTPAVAKALKSVYNVIVDIIEVIVTSFESSTKDWSVSECLKSFKTTTDYYFTITRFTSDVYFKRFINWVSSYFTKDPLFRDVASLAEFNKYYCLVAELATQAEDSVHSLASVNDKITQALVDMNLAYTEAVALNDRNTNHLGAMKTRAEALALKYKQAHMQSSKRPRPVSVALFGAPGMGKNLATNMWATHLFTIIEDYVTSYIQDPEKVKLAHDIIKSHARKSSVYTLSCVTEKMEFDDGYANQAFVVFEELFTSTSREANARWSAEFFKCIDNAPYLMNMAFVKGSTMFDSPFVFANGNGTHVVPMADATAYYRRVDFDFKVSSVLPPRGDDNYCKRPTHAQYINSLRFTLSPEAQKIANTHSRPNDLPDWYRAIKKKLNAPLTFKEVTYLLVRCYIDRWVSVHSASTFSNVTNEFEGLEDIMAKAKVQVVPIDPAHIVSTSFRSKKTKGSAVSDESSQQGAVLDAQGGPPPQPKKTNIEYRAVVREFMKHYVFSTKVNVFVLSAENLFEQLKHALSPFAEVCATGFPGIRYLARGEFKEVVSPYYFLTTLGSMYNKYSLPGTKRFKDYIATRLAPLIYLYFLHQETYSKAVIRAAQELRNRKFPNALHVAWFNLPGHLKQFYVRALGVSHLVGPAAKPGDIARVISERASEQDRRQVESQPRTPVIKNTARSGGKFSRQRAAKYRYLDAQCGNHGPAFGEGGLHKVETFKYSYPDTLVGRWALWLRGNRTPVEIVARTAGEDYGKYIASDYDFRVFTDKACPDHQYVPLSFVKACHMYRNQRQKSYETFLLMVEKSNFFDGLFHDQHWIFLAHIIPDLLSCPDGETAPEVCIADRLYRMLCVFTYILFMDKERCVVARDLVAIVLDTSRSLMSATMVGARVALEDSSEFLEKLDHVASRGHFDKLRRHYSKNHCTHLELGTMKVPLPVAYAVTATVSFLITFGLSYGLGVMLYYFLRGSANEEPTKVDIAYQAISELDVYQMEALLNKCVDNQAYKTVTFARKKSVDPAKAVQTVIGLDAQGADFFVNMASKIRRNMYVVVTQQNTIAGHSLALGGTLFAINRHVLYSNPDLELVRIQSVCGSLDHVYLSAGLYTIVLDRRGEDVVIINVPASATHAHVWKKFASREDLSEISPLSSSPSCIMTYNKVTDEAVCDFITNVVVSERSPLTFNTRSVIERNAKPLIINDYVGYIWRSNFYGACGSPVLRKTHSGALRVVGLHTAGSPEGVCYANTLCREEIEKFFQPGTAEYNKLSVLGANANLDMQCSTAARMYAFDDKTGCFVTDKASNPVNRSVLRKTCIADHLPESFRLKAPAALDEQALTNALDKQKHSAEANKASRLACQIIASMGDKAFDSYPQIHDFHAITCRELTTAEAIWGSPELGIPPVDLNTADTVFLRGLGVTKDQLRDPQSPESQIVVREIDKLVDNITTHDRFPLQVNSACLKDELRPLQRVQNKVTRLFNVTDFASNMIFRRALGHLMSVMGLLFLFTPACCGINPVSKDWGLIADKFAGINLVCKDVKGMDEIMSMSIANSILVWCSKFSKALRHKKLIAWAVRSCVMSIRFVRGIGYVLGQGNSSGNQGTTFLNSMCMYLMEVTVHIVYFNECARPIDTIFSTLVIKLYSDDTMVGYKDCVPDIARIAQIFRDLFGTTVTAADKSQLSQSHLRPIDEANFLSRGFSYNGGMWHAPLDFDSLVSQLTYVRVPNTRKYDTKYVDSQLQVNIDNVGRELGEYLPLEAARIAQQINDALDVVDPSCIRFLRLQYHPDEALSAKRERYC